MSSASVKEKLNTQTECADKLETNYMNNVQIIPSNYSPTDQNSIVTVQVTNDTNTPSQSIEPVSAPKSVLPTASEPNDEVQNARQFGAVTNISIGEKQAFQQEQLHYEQVFITHTPSGASISTGNSEPIEVQPKINRIKVDPVIRPDDSDVRPSTSTSSTVTLSVAAATGSIADSSISNSAVKSKGTSKNRTIENNQENDALSARRPLLSRGVTEAVILRPSRKDVNMLLNRINPQGNHVSHIFDTFIECEKKIGLLSFCLFRISVHPPSSIQTHSNAIRPNKEREAPQHRTHKEIAIDQIIITFHPVEMLISIITV